MAKYTSVLHRSGILYRWWTKAYHQTQSYYERCSDLAWENCISFEGSKQSEASTILGSIGQEWDRLAASNKVDMLKPALRALGTYQFDNNERESGAVQPIEDLLVPLLSKRRWIGVLRINVDWKMADPSKAEKLRRDICNHEREFEAIAQPLGTIRGKQKRRSFMLRKIDRELSAGYVDLLLRILTSSYEDAAMGTRMQRELRLFLLAANKVYGEHSGKRRELFDVDTTVETVWAAMKAIIEGVVKPSRNFVVLVSFWRIREATRLSTVEDQYPMLIGGGKGKRFLHRFHPDDMEYEFDKEEDQDLRELSKTFYDYPVYKTIERVVDYAITQLSGKNQEWWYTPLDRYLCNLKKENQTSIAFASILSREPNGILTKTKDSENQRDSGSGWFSYLYVRRLGTTDSYISILAQKKYSFEKSERTVDILNELERTDPSLSLVAYWVRKHTVARQSAIAIENNLRRHFMDRDKGSQVVLVENGERQTQAEIREKENLAHYLNRIVELSQDSLNRFGPMWLVKQARGSADDSLHEYYIAKLLRGRCYPSNKPSIGYQLADSLEFRSLFVIPIVLERKLVALINLMSSYQDMQDEHLSGFEETQISLFNWLKTFIEDHLEKMSERVKATEFQSHYLRERTVAHVLKTMFFFLASSLQQRDLEIAETISRLLSWSLDWRQKYKAKVTESSLLLVDLDDFLETMLILVLCVGCAKVGQRFSDEALVPILHKVRRLTKYFNEKQEWGSNPGGLTDVLIWEPTARREFFATLNRPRSDYDYISTLKGKVQINLTCVKETLYPILLTFWQLLDNAHKYGEDCFALHIMFREDSQNKTNWIILSNKSLEDPNKPFVEGTLGEYCSETGFGLQSIREYLKSNNCSFLTTKLPKNKEEIEDFIQAICFDSEQNLFHRVD
jgi:hypothetical protein